MTEDTVSVKKLSRLAAAAEFLNHPDGYLVLRLEDTDGGRFNLTPMADDDSIYLPAPTGTGYRVAVSAASPEVLKRFGTACLNLARAQSGAAGDVDSDDE